MRNRQILRTNSTDRLREMRTRGREGVQKSQIFADVLYGWSLSAKYIEAIRGGAKNEDGSNIQEEVSNHDCLPALYSGMGVVRGTEH